MTSHLFAVNIYTNYGVITLINYCRVDFVVRNRGVEMQALLLAVDVDRSTGAARHKRRYRQWKMDLFWGGKSTASPRKASAQCMLRVAWSHTINEQVKAGNYPSLYYNGLHLINTCVYFKDESSLRQDMAWKYKWLENGKKELGTNITYLRAETAVSYLYTSYKLLSLPPPPFIFRPLNILTRFQCC